MMTTPPSQSRRRAEEEFVLCFECSNHLTLDDKKAAEDTIYAWPGFIWNLVYDETIRNECGSYIWRFIPVQWRHWWINSMNSYNMNVTLTHPPPSFVDITQTFSDWDTSLESMMLLNIAKACNKYLMPTVLCPWGCSSFMHRSGIISLDIVFQRFLPRCLVKLISKKNQFKYVLSARDDFMRETEKHKYESILLNERD